MVNAGRWVANILLCEVLNFTKWVLVAYCFSTKSCHVRTCLYLLFIEYSPPLASLAFVDTWQWNTLQPDMFSLCHLSDQKQKFQQTSLFAATFHSSAWKNGRIFGTVVRITSFMLFIHTISRKQLEMLFKNSR